MVSRLITIIVVGGLALVATPVSGHAFGQRYDLPIPLSYFLIGAVATVALSFVVVGMFVQKQPGSLTYPKLNLLLVPGFGRILASRGASTIARSISVALFLLLLATGLAGSERAVENLTPTFVWIIWWVGMGYIVALVGNLWIVVNPWKITFEWFQKITGGRDGPEEPPFRYPEGLGVWPAFLLFFLFAWAENVYTAAFLPFQLAIMILIYSLIMWAGMATFGKHTWLRHAEAFTVLFGFFARFSPTEIRVADRRVCRRCGSGCADEPECVDCYECFEDALPEDRELNLRPYAVGLALQERVPLSTGAFVILALATVTFDGFQDTATWQDLRTALLAITTVDVIDTVALMAAPVLFAAIYGTFMWGVRRASGDSSGTVVVARSFVLSLVPIALAYNLAHFITLLLIQGQLIVPLMSDPFGTGSDLLGTADYKINLNVIGAQAVWFISLVAIVVGHVTSVYLAHVISLRRVDSPRSALRGQLPMLGLMILYTASSLWIVAQPIVG